MSTPFLLQREEVSVSTQFTEPAFRLFEGASSAAFMEGFWRRLNPLGLSLNDLQGDSEGYQLGRTILSASLDSYGVQIRIRFGGVELWANLRQVGFDRAALVYSLALEAIRDVSTSPPFATYMFTYHTHGKLEAGGVSEFVARLGQSPPAGLGPHVGSGVSFYFGPEEDRLVSGVNLDLSAVVVGGLYFRVDVTLDGSKIDYSASAARAREYIRAASEKFGLVPTK